MIRHGDCCIVVLSAIQVQRFKQMKRLAASTSRRVMRPGTPEEYMEPVSHGIIFWLIIGGIAGALAGRIVEGGGFGIVVDIIVGIVGAFIGGWLGGVLGIHLGSGIIGSLITALIGAVILLFIVRLFSRGRAGPTV
jgi:uncharacterized membrane protein YeaQ/YmgE (transglycosylase-associated protein family)